MQTPQESRLSLNRERGGVIMGGIGSGSMRPGDPPRPGAGLRRNKTPVRTRRVQVRLTEALYAAFDEARGNVPISAWIRMKAEEALE